MTPYMPKKQFATATQRLCHRCKQPIPCMCYLKHRQGQKKLRRIMGFGRGLCIALALFSQPAFAKEPPAQLFVTIHIDRGWDCGADRVCQNEYHQCFALPESGNTDEAEPVECPDRYPNPIKQIMGQTVAIPHSTTKLTTKDFSDYLNKIEAVAQNMGIRLPIPDDYKYAMEGVA